MVRNVPDPSQKQRRSDFDDLVDVMFKGVFFLTQKLVPLIADGGSIVNISSGMTRFYVPQRVIYSATKAAVETLTRHLAQELGATEHHRQHDRARSDGNGLQWRPAPRQ